MARFQMDLPNDLIKEFQKLEKTSPKMLEEMTQAGAEVVYKNVISNMKSSFKDSHKLEKHLKITKAYTTPSDDGINTKVAFYGYYKPDKKTFSLTSKSGKQYSYNGIPVPLIVRAREFGSSSGERKKPFFRKSFKKAQIEKEMLRVQDKYLKGLK
jgi:hypothetical protein